MCLDRAPTKMTLDAKTDKEQDDLIEKVANGILEKLPDAFDVYLRLMELGTEEKDWKSVRSNAERALAVNPLLAAPYRHLAEATEALKQIDAAIGAWQTTLKLDPRDPAEAHYRLAQLLHSKNHPDAKRHLLMSLEEAPRFREAHRLLLEMNGELK